MISHILHEIESFIIYTIPTTIITSLLNILIAITLKINKSDTTIKILSSITKYTMTFVISIITAIDTLLFTPRRLYTAFFIRDKYKDLSIIEKIKKIIHEIIVLPNFILKWTLIILEAFVDSRNYENEIKTNGYIKNHNLGIYNDSIDSKINEVYNVYSQKEKERDYFEKK